jgi:hypothetical protein
MHHIIYLSQAALAFSDALLQDLLLQARRHNAEMSVTGILCYGNQQFMQVIEGPEEVVRALYERIKQDPRHYAVTTYADKEIDQRAFAGWGMAYQPLTPEQFSAVLGYVQPDNVVLDVARLHRADAQLLELLRSFVLTSGTGSQPAP